MRAFFNTRKSEVSLVKVLLIFFFVFSVFVFGVFVFGGNVVVKGSASEKSADKAEDGSELYHCVAFNADGGKEAQDGVTEKPADNPADEGADESACDGRQEEERYGHQTTSEEFT